MASWKGRKAKKYRIRIVGGGYRWSKDVNRNSTGGSMKAQRRAKRKAEKAKRRNRG